MILFRKRKGGISVENYTVKQIAEMLNTQPETVRRWIRNGKLHAEKASRKEGHVISDTELNKFLKSSPKYAGMAAGLAAGAALNPLAAVAMPVVGGMAATFIAAKKRSENKEHDKVSKAEMKNYIKDEIERRTLSIEQKLKTIEQLQREITNDQQQIAECNFVLGQLETEDE